MSEPSKTGPERTADVDLQATSEAAYAITGDLALIPAQWGAAGQPARFGNYEVIRELGSGAFGSVYQARNAETGSVVAIKVLKET